MLLNYQLPIIISIIAFVFCEVLIDEGMILYKYWELINKLKNRKLYKVLGGCTYCFAGQLCLWITILNKPTQVNIFEIIIYCSITIFLVKVYKRWI